MPSHKIVIHGVHRSGTSLTANIIEQMGAWYANPAQRMPPRPDNPKGFWERLDVVGINDDILHKAGLSWNSLQPPIPDQEIEQLRNFFSNRIGTVLSDLDQHQTSFLKEPRFAFTWPIWQTLMSGNLHHIVVTRHPMMVARSLLKRNNIPLPVGLTLWTHQTIAIQRALLGQSRVCHVIFDTSESGITNMVDRIAKFVEENKIPLRGCTREVLYGLFDYAMVQTNTELDALPDGFEATNDTWQKISTGRHAQLDLDNRISTATLGWSHLQSKSSAALMLSEQWTQYEEEIASLRNQMSAQLEQSQQHYADFLGKYADILGRIDNYQHSSGYKLSYLLLYAARLFKKPLPNSLDYIRALLIKELDITDDKPVSANNSEAKRLIGAIRDNPGLFVRKLSLSRIIAGLRVLLGKQPTSLNMDQVLSNYSTIPIRVQLKKSLIKGPISVDQVSLSLSENPDVSIVIPVFNEFQTTLKCLKSIELYTNPEIYTEVVIADDCSTDETKTLCNMEGIRYIRAEKNLGFLGNCNHATTFTKGRYIVLLNNDTNVQEGWLDSLFNVLEKQQNVGIAGPMLVYPDGKLQEAGGIIFQDASGWNYGRGDNPFKPEYLFNREVDYISGACLMFRKADWQDIGGFDQRFAPAYYEDTDFCFTMRQRGKSVVYVPSSMVVHFEGVSHGTDDSSGIKQHQVTNQQTFREKWQDTLDQYHELNSNTLYKARTHARKSKSVLVIDHYVPMKDKDAGSRSTFMYLELFKQEGMNVTFVGDNFYPHQPYTQELQSLGIEVMYGDDYKDNFSSWAKSHIKYFDVVYIHRPHIASKYIDMLRNLKDCPRIVYFGHDLHYIRVQRETDLGTKNITGLSVDKWKALEFDIMRKSDVVLFPSQLEVDEILHEDPGLNAGTIPLNWFDSDFLEADRKLIKSPSILFVGGFGHPPNLDGLNWFLDTIFPEILRQVANSKLTIIGSRCPEEVFARQNESIDVLGEVSDEQLEAAYLAARVCVVPLRYGAGVKGKILEAMAKGRPVITTPVGAEGILPPAEEEAALQGFLKVYEDPLQFARGTVELLQNDSACNEQVNLASRVLVKHFSRDSAKIIFKHFFD